MAHVAETRWDGSGGVSRQRPPRAVVAVRAQAEEAAQGLQDAQRRQLQEAQRELDGVSRRSEKAQQTLRDEARLAPRPPAGILVGRHFHRFSFTSPLSRSFVVHKCRPTIAVALAELWAWRALGGGVLIQYPRYSRGCSPP